MLVQSHYRYRQWYLASKIIFFLLECGVIKQLVGELMSSNFIAVGLFTATTGTGSGISHLNFFIFS
jgi:hypothetical protein